jgi:hypothetical protein
VIQQQTEAERRNEVSLAQIREEVREEMRAVRVGIDNVYMASCADMQSAVQESRRESREVLQQFSNLFTNLCEKVENLSTQSSRPLHTEDLKAQEHTTTPPLNPSSQVDTQQLEQKPEPVGVVSIPKVSSTSATTPTGSVPPGFNYPPPYKLYMMDSVYTHDRTAQAIISKQSQNLPCWHTGVNRRSGQGLLQIHLRSFKWMRQLQEWL